MDYALKKYNRRYAMMMIGYVRKYFNLFENPSTLETFSNSKKNNILKSLIAYSKCNGFYEEFKKRIDFMIQDIKSSAKRPGFNEILLPGEPEWIEEEKARKEGVYLDDPWWQSIVDTAKELGINVDAIMKN